MTTASHHARLAAAVLVLAAGAGAQLPDWTVTPISPGAVAAVEATVVRIVDGNTVWLYSALTRAWTSITSASSTPVVSVYNDHIMVQDGTTFQGYSPRNPAPATLATAAGTLVSTPPQTWISVVRDGASTWAFLAYYGTWIPIPTTAPATVLIGRWNALVSDGANVWGISAYHASPALLGVPGATPTGSYGYQGFATSPGFVHGFSASRATWTSLPVGGAPSIVNGATQSGFSYVVDGGFVHFFSGLRGAFASTIKSASGTVTATSRTVGVVRDGPVVKLFSATKGTISTVVYPSPPTVTLKDYHAILSDGTTLLAFSGTHGAFAAPVAGLNLGTTSMNLAVGLDPVSGNLSAVYSAFQNAWIAGPVPPVSVQAAWTSGLGVVVQDATGFHGISAHASTWTWQPAPAPEVVWTGGGDWLARTGTTLLTFNPNTGTFAATATNAPVTSVNMHDATHIAIDGDGSAAYAFSHFTNHWAVAQLSSPVVQFGADKQAAFVNDGTNVYAFSGIGQVSNVNEYPDWVRMLPAGGLFLGHLSGEIGSSALLAVSAVPANIPTPFGTLWIDPAAMLPLFSGTIPASGVQTVPVPVPDSPFLAGLTLYFQGAVFSGPGTGYLTDFAQATIL